MVQYNKAWKCFKIFFVPLSKYVFSNKISVRGGRPLVRSGMVSGNVLKFLCGIPITNYSRIIEVL